MQVKKMQVKKPGGSFEPIEERADEPSPGWVRIRVQACGICHSDALTKEGAWPGIAWVVDVVGEGGGTRKAGDRVGVGWYGGHWGKCERCRRGDFMTCVN